MAEIEPRFQFQIDSLQMASESKVDLDSLWHSGESINNIFSESLHFWLTNKYFRIDSLQMASESKVDLDSLLQSGESINNNNKWVTSFFTH